MLGAQVLGAGDRVGPKAGPGRPRGVRRVVEVGTATLGAGRPPVVVDGDRIDARFGEPERELLVERRQPADVGEDDHARADRRRGMRAVRRTARPVGRGQLDERAVDRGTRDRSDRRTAVMVDAHAILLALR